MTCFRVAFVALAVAMMELPRREILDFYRVFSNEDGAVRDVVNILRTNLRKYLAKQKDSFSAAVSDIARQTVDSIFALVKFSETEAKDERSSIGSRKSVSRRYSVDTGSRPRASSGSASAVPHDASV